MNLVRRHKISLITGIPLTGRDKAIIDFIEDKLSGLVTYENNRFPKSIFYMKNGKVILEYVNDTDTKNILGGALSSFGVISEYVNDTLWYSYDDFWVVLDGKYDMKYKDIHSIMKYMVEQSLKIKVDTQTSFLTHWVGVEQDYDIKK